MGDEDIFEEEIGEKCQTQEAGRTHCPLNGKL